MEKTENSILITGGAGFIGSHVAERLAESGNKLIIVDNFESFLYERKIKEKNIKKLLTKSNVTICEVDLRDSTQINNIIKENNCSQVLHLAARAGVRPSLKYPLEYEEFNVRTTLNLLEICRKNDVENFVFGSSSSVYGANTKVPFSEMDPTAFSISPYGASKKACEVYCFTYSHLYSIPITCLRYFTVYGPRQRPEMAIHLFTKLIDQNKSITIFGDGTSKRDYTYISDIVDGTIAALERRLKFEIINLGNSNPVELGYLIRLIEKELNKTAHIKQMPPSPGDPQITFADVTKAQKLLNYSPKVPIEDGIIMFVEWYRQFKSR